MKVKIREIYGKKLSFDSIIVRSAIEIAIPMLIFVVVASFLFYQNTIQSLDDQILESNYSELTSVSDVYDKTFESVNYIVNYISLTNEMKMYFSAQNPYEANVFYHLDIESVLDDIKNHADYIHSVNILVENDTGTYVHTTNKGDGINVNSMPWYADVKREKIPDGIYTYPCAVEDNYPYLISFVRKSQSGDNKCYLAVNVELRELNNFVLNSNPERFYIIKGNKVLYNRYMGTMMSDFCEIPTLKSLQSLPGEKSFFMNDGNKKSVVSVKKSRLYDWSYMFVNSVDSNSAERNSKKIIAVIFMLSALLMGIFVSIKYVSSIYYPIREIESSMNGKKKNEEKNLPSEIKNISNKIIDFANANENLKNELDNRLEILKKYQVYSLQAQINPHFMFNVLNTIYLQSISDYETDRKTSEMLLKISRYLRYVLDGDREVADIETELEYAEIYVDFLKERYEELKNVKWDIDEEIKECKILKLCLQPVLENAVYHGISRKKESDGELYIGMKKENDKIVLTVTDNGIGIEKDELDALKKRLSLSSEINSEHIGLSNINVRIKLLYGDEYGVEIDSVYNGGTTVKLILPII